MGRRNRPRPEPRAEPPTPAVDEPAQAPRHRPWVGLLVACIVPGAAHALTGHRLTGCAWFAAIHGASLLGLWFFALPGDLWLAAGLAGFLAAPLLWLVMMVKSYRPLPRLRLRDWLALGVLLVLSFLPLQLVFWPGIEGFVVSNGTMAPTILRDDKVIVSRFALQFSDPARWDVVAFRHRLRGSAEQGVYVCRVVGLPGETIRLHDGQVEVDGQLLPHPPALVRVDFRGYRARGTLAPSGPGVNLGADEYLVLADSSENALDSRVYGPVARQAIFGRVTRIFSPAERLRTSLTAD